MLITKDIANKLPALGKNEAQGLDAIAQVKLFTPDSNWTWYATEYDPESGLMFGLVDGFEQELGYFNINEVAAIRGGLGLPVERDRYFTPTPLKDLMES